MDNTEKIVELDKYRKRGKQQRPKVRSGNIKPAPESAVKEMAYHMLKALECARQLL